MFDNLNKKHFYFSIAISIVLFILLNFFVGPTSVFGLAEFIQNKTGYFFGVDINTFDYLLISSIPICGLILTEKRNSKNLSKILKDNLIICLSCVLTFSIGLFLLISKIGSPSENPLIPEYLRVEPFKIYSTFFIGIGIILPFLINKKYVEKTKVELRKVEYKNYKIIMDADKLKTCDECNSEFNKESSEMENLCPECSSVLYGYPNCEHNFIENRCEKCYWNGKSSEYIEKIKAKK